MTVFIKMIEDPAYDEEGVLIDEESDESDWEEISPEEWDAAFSNERNYDLA